MPGSRKNIRAGNALAKLFGILLIPGAVARVAVKYGKTRNALPAINGAPIWIGMKARIG